MKEAVKYLMGVAGPSGFGSSSTGEQVAQHFTSLCTTTNTSYTLTAIITGATSGIGAETARVLARQGVRVVIPARDLKRGIEVKERIEREIRITTTTSSEIIVMEMDLTSFASIKRFCSDFLSKGLPLNILINNAGKYCRNLEFTEDKFEMTFATNYLGHYLVTETLLDRMIETATQTGIESRIINVSSVIHSWVNIERFHFYDMINPKYYSGTRAYAQSKLANILHAKELARQLRERKVNVTINAVHPGIVKTGIIRDHRGFIADLIFFLASKLLKSVSQGSSTICYVTLSSDVLGTSGKYFADCNETSCSNAANDKKKALLLWQKTHELVHRTLDELRNK